jgi:hypothetical protein
MGQKVVLREGVGIYVLHRRHERRVGGRERSVSDVLQRKSHDIVPDLGRVIGPENLHPVHVHGHLAFGVPNPHR